MPVPLAEVLRGPLVESVHRGSVVAVDPAGSVLLELGDTDTPMYPRSAVKPLQALAMLRSGLELDGELLALACASHGGEPFHIDGVRRMLRRAGLTETDLGNTPGLPLDERARAAYGTVPSAVGGNCSGKHAAMLASCLAAGWPTAGYREPEHPLQRAIAAAIAERAREPIAATAVDGCGAPAFALTLRGLARAFANLRGATDGPERRITAAMSGYPEWVDGTRRSNTATMRALPGSVAKGGAEGVLALALPDGPAVAVKIADGARRPLDAVTVAVLGTLGVASADLQRLRQGLARLRDPQDAPVRAVFRGARDDLPLEA